MTGHSLTWFAVAGILLSAGPGPVLAQTQLNAKAAQKAAALTPTSLAVPRPNDPPEIDTAPASTSQADTPPIAITPPDTSLSGASPNSTSKSAPHHNSSPAAAKGVLVVTTQHPGWGRIGFALRGNPAPVVHPVPGGIEVHLAPGIHLEVPPSAQLRETGPIEVRDEGGAAVAVIHLTCHCSPEQDNGPDFLRLDIHQDPAPPPVALPVPAAGKDVAAKTETTPSQETA
ncbi:MAG TPA: hypothetical protein VHX39_35210, partial [Acetobacteraceae bacterium]|nr:hypothetical protein [Acetobacteraceae bacterium]